jgi:hemolysin III
MSPIASKAAPSRRQSLSEETANAASHGIGAVAALVVSPFLVAAALRGGRPAWPYIIFGLSLVILFAASSLYHAACGTEVKKKLRVADHASIYVLIAGTYSPYSMSILGGGDGLMLFIAVWVTAACGIALCVIDIDRFKAAGPFIYIAMGWFIAPFMGATRAALPRDAFALLIAGGLCYTLGVVFYAVKRVPYFHVVWHLCVLAGAGCHVASLWLAAAA